MDYFEETNCESNMDRLSQNGIIMETIDVLNEVKDVIFELIIKDQLMKEEGKNLF